MGPGYKAREQGGAGGGGGSPGVPASARALVGQAEAAEHSSFHWAELLLDVMLN